MYKYLVVCLLLIPISAFPMTRTLKREPAIVIVAFGTTTSASVTYDWFDAQLKKKLPERYRGLKIEWAFTSEIVRQRVNERNAREGRPERLLSLLQVLSNLEDEGYRKIAVQPLHLTPGQEYDEVLKAAEAFRTLGLHIEVGDTLMHLWDGAFKAIDAVAPDFLPAKVGCNILLTHGTPETFPGSNSTYLGLERYVEDRYPNTYLGTVSGIVTKEETIKKAVRCPKKLIRIIPFLFVAGDHIINDAMGITLDSKGEASWKMLLNSAGFEVEVLRFNYNGKELYKGLGFNERIDELFINHLVDTLERFDYR